jgi:hypothetical protein
MRFRSILTAAVALAGLICAVSAPAEAHRRAPSGWGEVRTVRHYGYYPAYNHVYYVHYRTDRYTYSYQPRSYYPYYNSGYWRPAHEIRRRYHYGLPPYYAAWGYPYYSPRRGHRAHHGRHYIGHW